MPKSKAQRRAAQKKRLAMIAALKLPSDRRTVTVRGRPKEPREIGPTAETLAKLQPSTLADLRAFRVDGEPFLSADLVEAGEEIHRAWVVITAGSGFKSHAGGSGADSKASERLQKVWRHWAGELFARCLVRPAKVVEWINPKLFGEDVAPSCDRDPKGAAGVLKRALEWWRLASRDVGRKETV